jgi:hypothetical protein
MGKKSSLRIEQMELREEPFPHGVLRQGIDRELFERLRAEWPPLDFFVKGQRLGGGTKIPISSEESVQSTVVSPLWKEFIERHRAPDFVKGLLWCFRDPILRLHPQLEERFGRMEEWKIGVRHRDSFSDFDLLVDCQLAIFTPSQGRAQSDRGPHVKLRNKLMTGFLLFADDEEREGVGGDWDFFAARSNKPLRYGMNLTVNPTQLKLVDTVPYAPNAFGMLVNCPHGYQGFRVRQPGAAPLRYLEITLQLPRRLFEVRETLLSALRNRWRTWTKAGVTDL